MPQDANSLICLAYGSKSMGILDELKDNIPSGFVNMTPHYFKEFVCELFNDSGYQVKTTAQVKKYGRSNLVGVEEINQVIRGREYHKCDKALLVTTSDFTKAARELAEQRDVGLWSWDRLYSEIKKIYFAPKPRVPKPCLEAIKEAYALDFPHSPKRMEAFGKAVGLALTEEGRKEIYEDMVNSGRLVDNYKEAVDKEIVHLLTHLGCLYEWGYQFSKAEGILQQALELNEGSYVAIQAMSDVLLKEGRIDEAIELWKEKIRKGLTADTQWLRDAERKKREGYSFHPRPSTIEELETLIDQGIIPKEQYDYRKKDIIEKQQRRELEKMRTLDTKKKEVEVQGLHNYYRIEDVVALHKDCCDLSCRRLVGKNRSRSEIGTKRNFLYVESYEFAF